MVKRQQKHSFNQSSRTKIRKTAVKRNMGTGRQRQLASTSLSLNQQKLLRDIESWLQEGMCSHSYKAFPSLFDYEHWSDVGSVCSAIKENATIIKKLEAITDGMKYASHMIYTYAMKLLTFVVNDTDLKVSDTAFYQVMLALQYVEERDHVHTLSALLFAIVKTSIRTDGSGDGSRLSILRSNHSLLDRLVTLHVVKPKYEKEPKLLYDKLVLESLTQLFPVVWDSDFEDTSADIESTKALLNNLIRILAICESKQAKKATGYVIEALSTLFSDCARVKIFQELIPNLEPFIRFLGQCTADKAIPILPINKIIIALMENDRKNTVLIDEEISYRHVAIGKLLQLQEGGIQLADEVVESLFRGLAVTFKNCPDKIEIMLRNDCKPAFDLVKTVSTEKKRSASVRLAATEVAMSIFSGANKAQMFYCLRKGLGRVLVSGLELGFELVINETDLHFEIIKTIDKLLRFGKKEGVQIKISEMLSLKDVNQKVLILADVTSDRDQMIFYHYFLNTFTKDEEKEDLRGDSPLSFYH